MDNNLYCGNARIISTKFGDLTKVSMHKDDINKVVKWMKENNSDWVNFAIKEKKEKTEGKPTHYCEIDEWKPDKKEATNTQSPQIIEDDLPPF